MKREIKFRVWNESEKKYFVPFDGARLDLALTYFEMNIKCGYPEQFTGLKDSNGKNIYEGDILHELSNPNWHSKVDNKYFIEFGYQDLGSASYQQTIGWNATDIRHFGKEYSKSKGILDLCIKHPGITAVVIGNVNENKELL